MGWRQRLSTLKKRVNEFAKKYGTQCSVLMIAIEGNTYNTCGTEFLCKSSSFVSSVSEACKYAIMQQSLGFEEETAAEAESQISVPEMRSDALSQHVFDMDVQTMRTIISKATAPPNASKNKDRRRHWYQPKNAPVWWIRTGLPFRSACHSSDQGSRFDKEQLWLLVNSLQQTLGIVPQPPRKRLKYSFILPQYQDDQGVGEHGGHDETSLQGNNVGLIRDARGDAANYSGAMAESTASGLLEDQQGLLMTDSKAEIVAVEVTGTADSGLIECEQGIVVTESGLEIVTVATKEGTYSWQIESRPGDVVQIVLDGTSGGTDSGQIEGEPGDMVELWY